jgi:hypothetical protein
MAKVNAFLKENKKNWYKTYQFLVYLTTPNDYNCQNSNYFSSDKVA